MEKGSLHILKLAFVVIDLDAHVIVTIYTTDVTRMHHLSTREVRPGDTDADVEELFSDFDNLACAYLVNACTRAYEVTFDQLDAWWIASASEVCFWNCCFHSVCLSVFVRNSEL